MQQKIDCPHCGLQLKFISFGERRRLEQNHINNCQKKKEVLDNDA